MICAVIACLDPTGLQACRAIDAQGGKYVAVGHKGYIPDSCGDGSFVALSPHTDRWALWNHGVELASACGYTEYVLVGDHCIPQSGIMASHASALQRNMPLISIGKCISESTGWNDLRQGMFTPYGTLLGNVSVVTGEYVACHNMGMNAAAVSILKNLHVKLMGEDVLFPVGYGHRIGYAAWLLHICMWFLPNGANAVKVANGGEQDVHIQSDDGYVQKLRETKVSLDMIINESYCRHQ